MKRAHTTLLLAAAPTNLVDVEVSPAGQELEHLVVAPRGGGMHGGVALPVRRRDVGQEGLQEGHDLDGASLQPESRLVVDKKSQDEVGQNVAKLLHCFLALEKRGPSLSWPEATSRARDMSGVQCATATLPHNQGGHVHLPGQRRGASQVRPRHVCSRTAAVCDLCSKVSTSYGTRGGRQKNP